MLHTGRVVCRTRDRVSTGVSPVVTYTGATKEVYPGNRRHVNRDGPNDIIGCLRLSEPEAQRYLWSLTHRDTPYR